jgi:hypothetical protein
MNDDLKKDAINEFGIKYWTSNPVWVKIQEHPFMWILKKKYDYWWKKYYLKRLTGWLKLRFLTEIGQFHWNQGEEVAHFTWFGEPCMYMQQQAKYKCVKTDMQNKMWKTKYIYYRYYRKKDPNPKKPLWDVPQSQAEAMLY